MTDKIIADAVRKYWKATGISQDVVVFFRQKYEFQDDSEWEECEELVESSGSDDFETVTFHDDFCEGQTEAMFIKIIPLWLMFRCARKLFGLIPDIKSIARILELGQDIL